MKFFCFVIFKKIEYFLTGLIKLGAKKGGKKSAFGGAKKVNKSEFKANAAAAEKEEKEEKVKKQLFLILMLMNQQPQSQPVKTFFR